MSILPDRCPVANQLLSGLEECLGQLAAEIWAHFRADIGCGSFVSGRYGSSERGSVGVLVFRDLQSWERAQKLELSPKNLKGCINACA
jgi:hypothetical protein